MNWSSQQPLERGSNAFKIVDIARASNGAPQDVRQPNYPIRQISKRQDRKLPRSPSTIESPLCCH
jgi:hypothetical protein